jgi:hypothetical protein
MNASLFIYFFTIFIIRNDSFKLGNFTFKGGIREKDD